MIDGSKFKAVNNRDRNFTRAKMERRLAQIEESVARYLHQLDSADRQEPSQARSTKTARLKEKIAKLKEEVKRLHGLKARMLAAPDQQISLTDPDSRSMATSGRGSGVVGYNVQVAVDTAHHLIITHEVTNVGSDRAQLARMAKQTKVTLEAMTLDVTADRGYFSGEEILECDKAGITVTLPKPMTSNAKAEGRFGKQDFRYVTEDDAYICPAGERLAYHYATEENGLVLRRYWTNACKAAPSKLTVPLAKSDGSRDGSMSTFSQPFNVGLMNIPRNAPAARDGRASLRHHQGSDGRHTLLDEDAAARCLRDGPARIGLQSHPCDEHHGYPATHRGNRGIVNRRAPLSRGP